MRLRLAATLAFALASALPAQVQAQSPTAADLVTRFNAITYGNFTTYHDVEGPVIVGGNLSGNGTFFNLGIPLGVTLNGFGSVNVYGSAAGASYNANGLAVRIGASSGGSFSGASSVTYNASFPTTAASNWSLVTALSTGLANLAPTTSSASFPTAGSNNAVITATPAAVNGIANVAVIDISASLLGSYPSLSVNPNGASTVIINVQGNYSAQPNWQNGAAWRTNVIWNFENATSVNFGSTGIQGTVIAPLATVTNNNPIDGGLFANSYNGNGELHYKPFTGSTAFLNSVVGGGGPSGGGSSVVAVPEPASLALLATGAGALALLRRRRAAAPRD